MKILTTIILFLLTLALSAQRIIKGRVYEEHHHGNESHQEAIPMANIYWQNTTNGVVANENGMFEISEPIAYPANLVISFAGYLSDTVTLTHYQKEVNIKLKNNILLNEFQLQERQASTIINTLDPHYTETLTSKELTKAACCNISESFETNASVDVNFTDAVAGTKKIQLLGLDGIYTQIQFENLPLIRGLSSGYELTYVPGPWVEAIQIKKGAGSVLNGYESITGQINLELKKPDEAEKFLINGYTNRQSRTELNVHAAQIINDKWSTTSLAHISTQRIGHDNNNDNFEDHPIRSQYNLLNRWKYKSERHRFQAGFRAVYDDLAAGQVEAINQQPLYNINIKNKQLTLFTKNGFLFPDQPYKSIGILNTFRMHNYEAAYGQKSYNAQQISGYLNVIYQTIIGQTNHSLKLGGSWVYDNYDKLLNDTVDLGRKESVPGVFIEDTYEPNEKNALVLGLRGDYHNTYGGFVTPRMHYKHNFTTQSVVRLSVGKGFRTTNPIIENAAALASSRTIFLEKNLQPEIAWNYGVNFTHQFELFNKEMGIATDYYYTRFDNQVVVDLENPAEIAFYNLNGRSFSHSFQAEYTVELVEALTLKTAYKWYHVKTNYNDGLKFKPLTARNRVLVNLGYVTNFDKWKFDATLNWFGKSRVPSTSSNNMEYVVSERSEPYHVVNSQVTKAFKHFEVYMGVENLFDYKQEDPIIAANDPFGPNFDASLVWGPIIGRNFYAGFRYAINK